MRLELIGRAHDPVGDRFAPDDGGDPRDEIVEALGVLDVRCRGYGDLGFERPVVPCPFAGDRRHVRVRVVRVRRGRCGVGGPICSSIEGRSTTISPGELASSQATSSGAKPGLPWAEAAITIRSNRSLAIIWRSA